MLHFIFRRKWLFALDLEAEAWSPLTFFVWTDKIPLEKSLQKPDLDSSQGKNAQGRLAGCPKTKTAQSNFVWLSRSQANSRVDPTYCEQLQKDRKYVIANQLLKSGTSIGANVREAQSPHSNSDFVAKMVIAAKEANETEYWLLLCQKSSGYPNPDGLLAINLSIQKLLSRIISTSKNGRPPKHQNIIAS